MRDLQESDFFDEALKGRLDKTSYRIFIGMATGVAFTATTNSLWTVTWIVAYVTFQVVERNFLLLLFRFPKAVRQKHVIVPATMVMFSNALFISLALPWSERLGPWGVLGFGFLVAGISLYSIMAAMASRWMFIAVFLPCGLGYLALPFLAYGQGDGWRPVVIATVGSVITVFAALRHWKESAELRRAEMAARLRAEDGDAAKTRFLAMVSHDLRTPLTAIRAGAAQLSLRGTGDTADNARLIEDASVMMRRLLDDLLDMFKTEAGQMAIEPVPLQPHRLTGELMRFWEPTAANKGLVLSLDDAAGEELPDWVEADPTRLRQILNNLLSNALKFTAEGSVTLRLQVDQGRIAFSVIDTGSGLTEAEAAALFQPYVQMAEGAAHGGGTGLGLAISRELARAMGGDLVLTSRKGEGACFTLTLPLVDCGAPEVTETVKIDAPIAEGRPLSVLVVDDHEINRRALTLILQAVEAKVDTAGSGLEALERLAQTPFDLVLLDVNMPGLDGWQTARRLRQTTGLNQDTPIVAVTGETSQAAVAACLDAGMQACVTKPIEPAELFEAMDRVMRTKQDLDKLAA